MNTRLSTSLALTTLFVLGGAGCASNDSRSGRPDTELCAADACEDDGDADASIGDDDVTSDSGVTDSEDGEDGVADAPDDSDVAQDTLDDSSLADAHDTGTSDTRTDSSTDGSFGGCDGVPVNACGGCSSLDRTPGAACGTCDDGVVSCDGRDATRCEGASLEISTWYRDVDGDGFGGADESLDACVPPSARYVDNDEDCNDRAPGVFPGAREICDNLDNDCDSEVDEGPDGESCLDACCDDALVCEDAECRLRCDFVRCETEEGAEICCGDGEICYANTCADPGIECLFTEDCAIDEFCDRALGICLPVELTPTCEFVPPVGEFTPGLDCRWTSAGLPGEEFDDVVATPIVINLTDDNGDGLTNADDIPEIVFLTYDLDDGCCNRNALIRVVDGECNADGTMTTIATIDARRHTNDAGIAAGDLDGDGVPEIVAVGMDGTANRPQGIVIYERTAPDGSSWAVRHENTEYPTWNVHTRGGPIINIADLEADGSPDIIVGNVVLNADATLKWDGVATSGGVGGIGNNAFLGPSSVVADFDLDGQQEVFAGNTLYEPDGEVAWTFNYTTNNSRCSGTLPCDGFNAAGDFDDDEFAELVSIRRGEVFVFEHTGEELARIRLPSIDCSDNESGPPTVADFDGDGRPEIGTASADYYVVADLDCIGGVDERPEDCRSNGVLWRVPNEDCSSRATGSSVFDFEGDGRAEVVYADETTFRIFDGRTGAVLYEDDTHGSHTRIEMPIVVDVDNDGNSEVIVPENGSRSGRPGVDVWADADDNWVRTRRIWNQHGYSVTNVTESGEIPPTPAVNWANSRLNNYRQNVQPAGLFDAPDLQVASVEILTVDACPWDVLDVRVRVRNEGALSAARGQSIWVDVYHEGELLQRDFFGTSARIFPRGEEVLNLRIEAIDPFPAPVTVVATIDGDNAVNECNEDNNEAVSDELVCGI